MLRKALKRKRFEAFSCPEKHGLPFNLPFTDFLALFHALNEGFHPVRAGALHLTGHVSVYIQRERRSVMPKILLNRLYIVARLNGSNSVAVPLWYNYDKPEKPRILRVFGYLARFFILFQTEKSSREVITL